VQFKPRAGLILPGTLLALREIIEFILVFPSASIIAMHKPFQMADGLRNNMN